MPESVTNWLGSLPVAKHTPAMLLGTRTLGQTPWASFVSAPTRPSGGGSGLRSGRGCKPFVLGFLRRGRQTIQAVTQVALVWVAERAAGLERNARKLLGFRPRQHRNAWARPGNLMVDPGPCWQAPSAEAPSAEAPAAEDYARRRASERCGLLRAASSLAWQDKVNTWLERVIDLTSSARKILLKILLICILLV